MTDSQSPIKQFHPYQPPQATPVAERPEPAWKRSLREAGVTESTLMTTEQRLNDARDWLRRNPGKVLGGMAAMVIALGLLGRASRRSKRKFGDTRL